MVLVTGQLEDGKLKVGENVNLGEISLEPAEGVVIELKQKSKRDEL